VAERALRNAGMLCVMYRGTVVAVVYSDERLDAIPTLYRDRRLLAHCSWTSAREATYVRALCVISSLGSFRVARLRDHVSRSSWGNVRRALRAGWHLSVARTGVPWS
jgi:hypothetical protein